MLVFDVHPWARPSHTDHLEERRRLLCGMETDMMPPEPAFARTSFPFDVTYREIPPLLCHLSSPVWECSPASAEL